MENSEKETLLEKTQPESPKVQRTSMQTFKAFSTLIGGFIFMFFPGCLYITGVIAPYIASYFGVTNQQATMIMNYHTAANVMVTPIGGYLAQRGVNPKIMLGGGAFIGLSLLTINLYQTSFMPFATFYVLGFSLAQGLTYLVPVHHVWLWFPDYPGLTSGIVLAGYGFGSLIFNSASTALINPDNEVQDQTTYQFAGDVNDRFEYMWRTLLICWAGCAAIGITFVWQGPKDLVAPQQSNEYVPASLNDNDQQDTRGEDAQQEEPKEAERLPIWTLVKSKQFVLIFIMNALSLSLGLYTVSHFKSYAFTNGLLDDAFLSHLGSAASFFITCRFVWSAILDKYPYKLVYGILLSLSSFFALTMVFVSSSKFLFSIWVCGILFCMGGHYTLVPNVLKQIYTEKYATQLYGILFSYTAITAFSQILLQSLFQTEEASSYNGLFITCGLFTFTALLILIFQFEDKKFQPQD